MSTLLPNTFQCFNLYIDRALEHLTDSELRILLYTTRHILGWQDKIKKKQGHISLTMFEKGYTTETGKHYGGCGLGRGAIIAACNSLVTLKFLAKVGEPNTDGQEWELTTDDIQWTTLEERTVSKTAKLKAKTVKATQASIIKRSSTSNVPLVTGTSHVTPTSTSDVTMLGTSHVHNQSHVSKPSSKPSSAKAPKPTSTDKKLPKRTAKFTRVYILAYNELMGTNSNLLVSAWFGGTYKSITELENWSAQNFIETNEELEVLGVGTDKYCDFVKHVKTTQHWQGRKNAVLPSEMRKCITTFKDSLNVVTPTPTNKPMTEAEYILKQIEREGESYGRAS